MDGGDKDGSVPPGCDPWFFLMCWILLFDFVSVLSSSSQHQILVPAEANATGLSLWNNFLLLFLLTNCCFFLLRPRVIM